MRFTNPSRIGPSHAALSRLSVPATTAACLLLGAGVFGLSLADANPSDGVLFLLGFPIGLAAARLGWRAGLAAALASVALVAAWDGVQQANLDVLGYLSRAAVYFGAIFAAGVTVQVGRDPKDGAPYDLLISAPQLSAEASSSYGCGSLSPRELEVLEMVARGATNAQIAARFAIAEDTVKSHVKRILHKLGVGNRTEAALRYVEAYGHPPLRGDDALATDAPARHGEASTPSPFRPTREVAARVAGFAADDRVILSLEGARAIDVPLLDPIRGKFEVGTEALVYFDANSTAIGWYLPDAGLGVDMRLRV